MPRDGTGQYNLPSTAVVTGTAISSSDENATRSDIATALTGSIARDGQALPTANLPMGGFRHTGVANATARNDYLALGQFQDAGAVWAGTAAGTANALTAAVSPAVTALTVGMRVTFLASATNTAAATFNLNAVSLRPIATDRGAALIGGEIVTGAMVTLQFEGTNWRIVAPTGTVLAGTSQVGQSYAYTASVGTTVASEQQPARFRSDATNTNEMQIQHVRTSAGSDWTGVAAVLRRVVDASQTHSLAFNGDGSITLLPFASSNTISLSGRVFALGTTRVGQNTADQPGNTNTTIGIGLNASGTISASVTSQPAMTANVNADGIAVGLYRSGNQVGSIAVTTTTTTYNTSSDRRLKDRISPLTGAWDRVKALLPRWHGWRAEPEGPVVRGFIADELAEVVPHAVTGAADAVDEHGAIIAQGVDYSKVVPDLTAALQEAMARIEALEGRLAS